MSRPADSVFGIGVEDVSAYAQRLGWRLVEHPNKRMMVYEGPPDDDGHPLHLVLPRGNEYDDSGARIADAVRLLATVQDVPEDAVVRTIRASDSDCLKLKLPGPVSLESAVAIVTGLKNLMAFAACVEEDPRPYFPKMLGIGRAHAERCRFGHTLTASFGFTVESPLSPPVQQPLPLPGTEPRAPFERRVMERVARGLSLTQEAALTGRASILVEPYGGGFNANLCEVALGLLPDADESEVEYTVDWSPEWKPRADVATLGPVRMGVRTRRYLETAARELRQVERAREVTVDGLITHLRAETAPIEDYEEDGDAAMERLVVIAWATQGIALNVRVPLDVQDYRRACDAHRDGVPVKVTGQLEKVGRYWMLMQPREFRPGS